MELSDVDLRKLLQSGSMKISPLEDDQIGQAGVDLTLSDWWGFFRKKYVGSTVDLDEVDFKQAHKRIRANSIELAPQQMCLGKTVEKISLPADIIGKLEGRSRYARMGLAVHVTSAIIQPGSRNHQVLEIVNMAPFAVRLHAGMRISQAVFRQLSTPSSKPYSKFGKIAKSQ
jgi:dCTP deaminase